jgi:tetratricopeptide (TPR) repeat protein
MEWLSSVPPLVWGLLRVVLVLVGLGALLFACAMGVAHRVRLRWLRYHRQAGELLRRGWSSQAEELYQEAAGCLYGAFRTAALAGVGTCRVHQGAYAEAVAILEPLMERERRLPPSMWVEELVLCGHLALSLTMLGDTRRAWRWLNEVYRRCDAIPTFLLMPMVATLCREGHMSVALKRMEQGWPLVKYAGHACSRLRLLRAYAHSKVDPERHAGSIFMTLYALAPFPKQELEFCREHWPALADFMEQGEALVAYREAHRARRRAEAAARAKPPAPEEDA